MHFTELVDLASERLGSAVLDATPGYDSRIIKLGLPGIPRGVVVDTAHFKGSHPQSCSLEACDDLAAAQWIEILPESLLKADCENLFSLDTQRRATHLRFKIYPDSGVTRLRVHGEVQAALSYFAEYDLAAVENGGLVIASSDMFSGSRQSLIMPGLAHNTAGASETRRRRDPGHDWVVIQLGAAGAIHRVEVDTSHFKGNYPDTCSLEACDSAGATAAVILPQTKLHADKLHVFRDEIQSTGPASYVRFNMYPDGGVSRLRLYGRRAAPLLLESELLACCGSHQWARRMRESQPFSSAEQMLEAAGRIWSELGPSDWLQAFAAHPRIGQSTADPRAAREQSGVVAAHPETLARLAAGNREYEERFGHIYIVCASGKTAAEMLAILESRLQNDPETELRVAAGEQHQITRLRLQKLLESK
jgi:allantoicase